MRHGETMLYLSNTAAQRAEMLRVIGADDVEALLYGKEASYLGVKVTPLRPEKGGLGG